MPRFPGAPLRTRDCGIRKRMSRRLYAAHRILAAVAFFQLAVWSISGFLFAVLPEASVRGAQVPKAHDAPLLTAADVMPPALALKCFQENGLSEVFRIELRGMPHGTYYLGRGKEGVLRINSTTCKPAPVDSIEAEAASRRDQPGAPAVRAVSLIEKAPIEYRGKPLPAYRVEMADAAETVVYVDAKTGDVTARRTGTWRTFDFLYGLHIMSYETRDGLNNPLLVAAAGLAVLTVVSGIALWAMRIFRWVRRRGAKGEANAGADVTAAG